MGVLSKFKKKGKGFQEKTRTPEEVNQEYNHHAVMYGHLSRVIEQNQQDLGAHMEAMIRLNAEGMAMQKQIDPPKIETPTAPPEGTSA